MDYSIRGLALYFSLLIRFLKNRCAAEWKPCSLKVWRYAARLIGLNEYVASLPGVNLAHKLDITELNEILLNSTPNIWSKQAYVQVFGC